MLLENERLNQDKRKRNDSEKITILFDQSRTT